MNASQMTFGIEIECQIPNEVIAEQNIRVGQYHVGQQVPGMPIGWTAQRDASIAQKPGYTTVEIVSPILQGEEGIASVTAAVVTLNTWKATVDKSCGFHVHVNSGLRDDVSSLRKLLFLTAKFERALFAVTGTKSREHSMYCQPMSMAYSEVRTCDTAAEIVRRIGRLGRYWSLNLQNLLNNKGTVEFRVFQGTTNLTKVLGYIQICLALVQNAHEMKRLPDATCTNKRHQTGKGMVYRMLRNFNWFKEKKMGYRRLGLLTPNYVETIKEEMMRLAKKYDAHNGVSNHAALRPIVFN
jgi:hypothetical protein